MHRTPKPSKDRPPASSQAPQLTPQQREELASLPQWQRAQHLMKLLQEQRQPKDQPT